MSPRFRLFFRRLKLRWARRWSPLKTGFYGYLLFLFVFSFLGDRGLYSSYQIWREGKRCDVANAKLARNVQDLRKNIELFRTDRRTIERYAREELHLAGDREIHYIFP